MKPHAYVIDGRGVRDIAPDVLDETGRLKVMPAAYYDATTIEERAIFGVRNGIYALPTVELIDWLRAAIGDRSAIEIGAGNGVIAEALGIPATDNRMQEEPAIRAQYAAMHQPTVTYGAHVEKLDALEAVSKYRPQVVVAAWVTHKYDATRHEAGGNAWGVDERELLRNVEQYIFVGNTAVHTHKAIWETRPAVWENAPWLYSRAMNGSPDFVAIWKGAKEDNQQ